MNNSENGTPEKTAEGKNKIKLPRLLNKTELNDNNPYLLGGPRSLGS